MDIAKKPVVIAAAISLIASFALSLLLGLIGAKPLPFLFVVTNLGVCFAGGLPVRALYTYEKTARRRATLLAAVVVPLSMIVGAGLSALAAALIAQTPWIQFVPAMKDLQSIFPAAVILLVMGGVLAATFAAWAIPPLLFLGVPLALYFTWIIAPTLATGYIALANWDGVESLDKVKFVGLANFDRLFKDGNFWIAFVNNVKWLAFFTIIPTSMGLAMAMIFNSNFPGSRFFKIAFYSPLVIAPAVVALVWESMYRPDDGLINSFLRLILGPNAQLPGWLADQSLVLWCIIVAAAWRQVGYVMILYLAGLKSLDVTLIEAATVDGASTWDRFRHVIFPLLGPVTVVVVVISVIDSLRAFDLVAIMTRGGPSYASEVMANFMYMRAFNDYRMGYAGAVAVILLVIMLFFIVPYLRNVARTELEY